MVVVMVVDVVVLFYPSRTTAVSGGRRPAAKSARYPFSARVSALSTGTSTGCSRTTDKSPSSR